MPDFRIAAVGYATFKAAVFAALTLNTAVYLATGTRSEGLDSVAWLTLLVSFELETGRREWFRRRWSTIALHCARWLAGAALAAAAVGYVRGKEWFDAINTGLWIGVVAMLEFEVRHPDLAAQHRGGLVATTVMLYAGLAGLVLAWLLRGEWFDAYDAALWLVAFATLELDLLGHFGNGRPST